MRKLIVLSVVFILLALCACENRTSEQSEVINITEKMYLTYITDIYANSNNYIGKPIELQGMYTAANDKNYVYRNGPGCCAGDTGMIGFEFTCNGEIPKDNDWIQVIGVLGSYTQDGTTYLTLNTKSIIVMETRGAETVIQ